MLYRRIGRTALTMVLLLATQLAFAGQVCRGVMVGSVLDGRPAQASGQPAHSTTGAMQPNPCSDGVAMSGSPCLTTLNAMNLAALAPGGAPPLDLAPPRRDRSMAAVLGAASISVPFPTTSVGPPLPSYIVFRRFLS